MKTKISEIEEEIKNLDKQREILDQEIKKKLEELNQERSRLKNEVSPAKRLLKLIGYVRIYYPLNRASVPRNTFIAGEVSDSSFSVWVIVHPMASNYWAFEAQVEQDGKWRTDVTIGREPPEGNADVGKEYQIMAIANPKIHLKEGEYHSWIDAEYKSDTITVIRQDKKLSKPPSP